MSEPMIDGQGDLSLEQVKAITDTWDVLSDTRPLVAARLWKEIRFLTDDQEITSAYTKRLLKEAEDFRVAALAKARFLEQERAAKEQEIAALKAELAEAKKRLNCGRPHTSVSAPQECAWCELSTAIMDAQAEAGKVGALREALEKADPGFCECLYPDGGRGSCRGTCGHAIISKALSSTPSSCERKAEIEAGVVRTISNLLDADPHQWSKRPCSTCAEISKRVGRDFGCLAYEKSPLTYSDYAKAAALRQSSQDAREKKA